MSKITLKKVRDLELLPYTPKPGEKMMNTLNIEVYRDPERKKIRFRAMIMNIKRENGFISKALMVFGDDVRIVVEDSPTHKPKRFAELADPIMSSIDGRTGYWWSECQSYLDRLGIQVAPQENHHETVSAAG